MKPRAFFLFIVILFIVSALQGQPSPVTGQSTAYLTGSIYIVWGDGDASNPQSLTRYFLTSTNQAQIELIVDQQAGLLELNRQQVSVRGTWLDAGQTFRVDTITAVEGQQPEGVFGPQPWVSVLCKFADYPGEPKALPYFVDMYASTYPGLNHYWQEQSFNLANLDGSGAFGWYTLPYNREHYLPGGNLDWDAAAQDCTAVADDDIYFPDYVGINLMFNADLDCCAWGGSWYLCRDGVCQNWRMTWEPPWGYENIGVIAHETGHGFGLPHSSGEYGQVYDNAWDVMSDVWSNGNRGGVDPVYGTMGQHTISYHKNMLEWIDSDHMIVVPTGTHITLPIERIALPQTGDPLGAKILINDSLYSFYTVETRTFDGYDTWLPGEAIIIHNVLTGRPEPAHVVDIDHNGNTGDEGAMWRVGETFADTVNGIFVTVEAATETGFIVTIENKFFDITSVALSGPSEGEPGEDYGFSADILPVNASEPITYVWEATDQLPITHTGGISDDVIFNWLDEGSKSITVTVSNPGSVISDTFSIDLESIVAAEIVEIDGPLNSLLGMTNTYTASVQPISTTLPITYIWQATGQEPLTHTGELTDTVSFVWDEPGEKVISLLAINMIGEVTTSLTTEVVLPELDVAITSIATGFTGQAYTFSAQVDPITATLPLTYVWTIGEMASITHTGGLTDALTLTWEAAGTYTITLTVSNIYTSEVITWEVNINERMFIPMLQK
jgi:hypothetical protein